MAKIDMTAQVAEAMRPMRLLGIASQAIQEVTAAREKHGPNTDLADGTGSDGSLLWGLLYGGGLSALIDVDGVEVTNAELELAMQKVNDDACAAGRKHTRAGILLEEAFEALATDDPAELRKELIQVIAMGLDWVADIDAR